MALDEKLKTCSPKLIQVTVRQMNVWTRFPFNCFWNIHSKQQRIANLVNSTAFYSIILLYWLTFKFLTCSFCRMKSQGITKVSSFILWGSCTKLFVQILKSGLKSWTKRETDIAIWRATPLAWLIISCHVGGKSTWKVQTLTISFPVLALYFSIVFSAFHFWHKLNKMHAAFSALVPQALWRYCQRQKKWVLLFLHSCSSQP